MRNLTLAVAISFLSLAACVEETEKTKRCAVTSPVVYADGAIPLTLALENIGAGATVRIDGIRSNKQVFGKVAAGKAEFAAIPTGPAAVYADNELCGDLRVAPAYAQVTTMPTLSGIDLQSVTLDADADGDLDIAVSNGLLMVNDGQANFKATRLFDSPVDHVSLGDFNADGNSDLLLWNRRGGRPISGGTVLMKSGAQFVADKGLRDSILTGSYGAAAIADLDDDRYTDAVTVSENGLWMRWNNGGTLAKPARLDPNNGREVRGFARSTNDYLSTIKIIDVDEDGRADIVFGRYGVAYQSGVRTFTLESKLFTIGEECAILNGSNECPRIVNFLLVAPNRVLALLRLDANRIFEGMEPKSGGHYPGTWYGEGDLDGDGRKDWVGFEEDDPSGVGFFSSLGMGELRPLFAQPTAGNISSILIGKFDSRQAKPQIVTVSGNRELTVFRQAHP